MKKELLILSIVAGYLTTLLLTGIFILEKFSGKMTPLALVIIVNCVGTSLFFSSIIVSQFIIKKREMRIKVKEDGSTV